MEKAPLKRNESDQTSPTINFTLSSSAETSSSNRIHTENKQNLHFNSEIERIYLENTGKNQLPDKHLRPESELLRKFVHLHSPDCLVVKMYLHDYSISLERGGVSLPKEVTIQYEEWTLFDHLDTGHLPSYLFNFLSRSDLTLYDGCVIIKVINCRHQTGTTANIPTSNYPEALTYYILLRPTPEIIALQTNLLLLQSTNLHTQHPYTVRHRALQIESCITQKFAPPLCLDTSPDVLLAANFNQFQRFKYNHPRLKRMRRKHAKYNTQYIKTSKQATPHDLKLSDYLNTPYVQGCKKPQKYSLLSSSLKECLLLKSSTTLVTNIAISRPERALESAISLLRRTSIAYSDLDTPHYRGYTPTTPIKKNLLSRSHSFAYPNNSYKPELQSLLMHNDQRRSSFPLDNPRYVNYTTNSSMHPESMSQFHTLSASTPGTPPVDPFTPLEDSRYPLMNENSHFMDTSMSTGSMNLMSTQRPNSFHTPSSVTSSEMHLRGNQQASIDCSPDSALSDVYFSRQNSHLSDHDSKQMGLQALPKFSNTFQNKPPTQFLSNTNKYPQKFYHGQAPSYSTSSGFPGPPSYQAASRIPHNIITPNQTQLNMESSLRQISTKRHLDPVNHIPPQAKRFSSSPITNQPSNLHYPKDGRHPNNVIRGNQSQMRVPHNYVSGRKMSSDFYHTLSNQLSSHDTTSFNHTPTQNSSFHINPVEPGEQ